MPSRADFTYMQELLQMIEVQQIPAPAPTPGKGPGVIDGSGRIVIEVSE